MALGFDKIGYNNNQRSIDFISNVSGLGSSTRTGQWNV